MPSASIAPWRFAYLSGIGWNGRGRSSPAARRLVAAAASAAAAATAGAAPPAPRPPRRQPRHPAAAPRPPHRRRHRRRHRHRRGHRAPPPPPSASLLKTSTSYFASQVAGVEVRREHVVLVLDERELEVLEDAAASSPTGMPPPYVIDEADARACAASTPARSARVAVPRSSRRDRSRPSAASRGVVGLRGDVERAVAHRAVRTATRRPRRAAIRRLTTMKLSFGLVREVVARRRACAVANRAGRRLREVGERLERPVEAVEDAIELHAHLERERVAGVVVRRASAARPDTGCRPDDPAARTCPSRADGTPARSSR